MILQLEPRKEAGAAGAIASELPSPRPTPRNASCQPPGLFKRPSGWASPDTPLFELRPGWVLATDWEYQWVVYHNSGGRFRAVCFPTSQPTVLRALRERVSDSYGTYAGINPQALARIQSWPVGHFSLWLNNRKNGEMA